MKNNVDKKVILLIAISKSYNKNLYSKKEMCYQKFITTIIVIRKDQI